MTILSLQPSLIIQRFAERTGFPAWLYHGTAFSPGSPLPEFIPVDTGIQMVANAARWGELAQTLPYAVLSFRASTLSALLAAFEHAPTLGDALRLLQELGGYRNGHHRFAISRAGGLTELQFQAARPHGEAAFLLNEPAVHHYFGLVRDMRLGDADGMFGMLMHGRHALSDTLWPGPDSIRYDQSATSLVLPTGWERERNPRHDPDIWHVARARCAQVATSLGQTELLFLVRGDMERRLNETGQLPSLAEVAAGRGVSPRTLLRRLKSAGSSYQHLQDELHKARAAELLRLPDARVHHVAEQLGFSDSSSFSRSFRRWYGCSPGAYMHLPETDAQAAAPMALPDR